MAQLQLLEDISDSKESSSTVYKHHSGREYNVILISNQNSTDQERFPTTVVYRSLDDGEIWSRPLEEFITKFQEVKYA